MFDLDPDAGPDIDARRLALDVAVSQLLEPDKVERPDGGGRGEVLPLLVAIEVALTERAAHRGTYTRPPVSTRAPLRLTPLNLLTDVDRAVGNHGGAAHRSASLRAWAARWTASPDADAVDQAADLAESWVASARSIIDPARWLPIRGAACPTCGRHHALLPDDTGDEIVAPALVADLRLGTVTCVLLDCGASWPAEHLELLAQMLDAQGRETLAVDPG